MSEKLTPEEQKKLKLIKLKRKLQKRLDECFDPNDLDSRPSKDQLEVLQDNENDVIYVVCPNRTGKSQTGGRAVSWWFQNKHPYVPSREEWGDKFTILVLGNTTRQVNEIWEKKIEPFLPTDCYKVKNGSSGIEEARNLHNGNKIIFASHHDAKNARAKVQGFDGGIVWLDEMPDDSSFITELLLRITTTNGIFLATFTPLVENENIRKIVDTPAPGTKRYLYKPEDNPALMRKFGSLQGYAEWLKPKCATEAEYRARMFGEWYYSSGRVIRAYDPAKHKEELPSSYHPKGWRHVAVVDPSASGLTGLTLWAEHPKTYVWYNVLAETIQGEAAYTLLEDIEERLAAFYVTERITDCNPAGFYREAHRKGIMYKPFTEKMERKALIIDGLNSAILSGKIVLTSASEKLEEEFFNCKWSENNPDKIVHSSKWHLIDTAQYFVDRMPKPEVAPRTFRSELHALKQQHTEIQVNKEAERQKKQEIAQKKKSIRIKNRPSKIRARRAGVRIG